MKEYQITYNGNKASVKINDRLKFDLVSKIEKTIKWKPGIPEISVKEYITVLATNLVTEAPWGQTTPDILNSLDMETAEELSFILLDLFPIERFLFLAGKAMYGRKLEVTESPSATASTTSSPSGA